MTELSTMRATKGNAAMTSGGMVAVEPMEVPTIKRVVGMSAMSRMRKGTERSRLMKVPSTLFSVGMGWMPSGSEMTSSRPSGSPMR